MSLEPQGKKIPKNKIVQNILATKFAYSRQNKEVEKLDDVGIPNATLLLSDMYKGTNSGKLRAAVFIDRENKQITYAIAGTRIHQGISKASTDIGDDLRLAVGVRPKKISAMQALNKMILEGLIDEAGNDINARANALAGYEINFTGHSLGAAIADCAAADMVGQMNSYGLDPRKSSISSITFDNPGATRLVKSVCKKYKGQSIIPLVN